MCPRTDTRTYTHVSWGMTSFWSCKSTVTQRPYGPYTFLSHTVWSLHCNISSDDEGRVILKVIPGVEGSDYINASYINVRGHCTIDSFHFSLQPLGVQEWKLLHCCSRLKSLQCCARWCHHHSNLSIRPHREHCGLLLEDDMGEPYPNCSHADQVHRRGKGK